MKNKTYIFFLITLSSCTGLRSLPEGEKLYTGSEVTLIAPEKIKHINSIRKEAESVIRPKPNKKFLGMRPKLWLYQRSGNTTKEKGFRALLKKKGEPPVFISEINLGTTAKYIDASLFNQGIFKGYTSSRIIEKKKTASILYESQVHQPFVINKVIYPITENNISAEINVLENGSLIKKGDNYNLLKIRTELNRIEAELKNRGYFYFSPSYLEFTADTSVSEKTIDLTLKLKDDVPVQALKKYIIGDIYVNSSYSIANADTILSKKEVIIVDSISYFNQNISVSPVALNRSIYLRKNELYKRENHNITLNRLMSLGTYKFVSIRFTANDSLETGILNTTINLTPMPKRTFRAEADLVTKSNDFTGPRLTINYKNRNTFNEAEILNIDLGFSFETQLSNKYQKLFSYMISPSAELIIPRFLTPFHITNKRSLYIPKTKISAGYTYNKRVDYFTLKSFKLSFGYKWKENIKKEHELLPLSIIYSRITQPSDKFTALLESNPLLQRSYEERLIAGLSYTFTFNEQVIEKQKNQFYFIGNAELAGTSISLFQRIFTGQATSSEKPGKIAGAIYSQYVRFTLDGRNYLNFNNKSKLVTRLFAGAGIPYGNSSTLPYIKQFFSGGPNSIRAFLINTVGPGTQHLISNDLPLSFLAQGGDIKLEANVEYRFPIMNMIKGALFSDAGNTWYISKSELQMSSPFNISTFPRELALGAGFGLRIDANFFVLRFDLSSPLRKPWLQGDKWVIKNIKPSQRDWRQENLILNIAIGYPF